MGPCPFRHGYDYICAYIDPPYPTLQWGHALSGMDTIEDSTKGGRMATLQWGHALSGMDTIPASNASTGPNMLQWGHALSGMDTETPAAVS